ncbi:MAG: ABC transporter permease [Chloroflexi bacterium]|nr:ABC transporter permease [Chloroflexota bacterium]
MNKIAVIFQFELRAVMSRRMFWITTALLPAVGVVVILVGRLIAAVADDDPSLVGYVDQWGKLPMEIPAEIPLEPYVDLEKAKTDLLDGIIEAYYVVPPDYVETGSIVRYKRSSSAIFSEDNFAPAILNTLLIQALVADEVPPDVAVRVQAPAFVHTVRFDSGGEIAPEERDELSRFLVPYLFSIMLLVAIGMTSGFLVQSITEEKQTRTIEVLFSSVSPTTLMSGKILGLGAAGIVQIAIWLTAAWLLATLASSVLPLPSDIVIAPESLALGALFFILGYFLYAALLVGVGAIATSPQEGGQVGGFATFAAAIPLVLISLIINEPNGVLARIFTFVPITAPVTVMLRMSATTIPWWDILGSAVVLVVAATGATLLSARAFRTFLLLYGRRPGLREIWRTMRSAG